MKIGCPDSCISIISHVPHVQIIAHISFQRCFVSKLAFPILSDLQSHARLQSTQPKVPTLHPRRILAAHFSACPWLQLRDYPFASPLSRFHFFPNPLLSFSPLSSPPSLPPKTLSLTLDSSNVSYGPSLHKGSNPNPFLPNISTSPEDDGNLIDRDAFARSFQIAALRVPADSCSALENCLRGHLLNWPRVRNVARVPGDDIDPDFDARLLPRRAAGSDEDEGVASVERRVYGSAEGDGEKLSPILHREKLVKTFNCRGFLKFKNLAKISRPKVKKRKKKMEEDEGGGQKRIGKNDFVAVEVIGHGGDNEDLSGLLGEEFKGGTWRGPTRLLLLDERYADNGEDELPEAVKVAFCDAS